MIPPVAPRELKIEITGSCDLSCTFCYLGEEAHGAARFMPEEGVLRWIDWAVDNGVPGVRFTGGEATLHPEIEMFCYYAHLRGRHVILNTNGMADDRLYRKLFRVVNDLRISLPALDAALVDQLTSGKNVLAKKHEVIGLALESRMPRITLLTPLVTELHGSLESFVLFSRTSPRLFWMPLRYESTPLSPHPWTRHDAQAFALEMADLMDRYPEDARGIYLAVPFCGVTPMELGAKVFHGRAEDCGPFVALNVNADGKMQACFGAAEMEGPRPLDEIRNCREIKSCISAEALPAECAACVHTARCAGGCRKPSSLVPHGGRQVDYLAGFLSARAS